MAGLKVVQHLDHRHGAGARGGHGALAAHDVVAVDHAAVLMGADGDSAADVADDEVAVLIGTAEGGRVADGRLLEVERMQVHVAVHAVDAGHPGGPAELVGVGRVDHKGAAAVGLGKAAGQRGAKVCRVRHAVGAADGVLEDEVGNLVDAALHGQQAATAADEGLHVREVDTLLGKDAGDGLGTERQLLRQRGEARQLLRAVADGLGEDALLAVKQGDLGGGGAGVYGKDAHGYSPSLADAAALAASAAAARMTSMATLPSISWTGAEREKSQTGAAKPCSTGP